MRLRSTLFVRRKAHFLKCYDLATRRWRICSCSKVFWNQPFAGAEAGGEGFQLLFGGSNLQRKGDKLIPARVFPWKGKDLMEPGKEPMVLSSVKPGQLPVKVHVRSWEQPNLTLSSAALEKVRVDTAQCFSPLCNATLLLIQVCWYTLFIFSASFILTLQTWIIS